MCIYIFVNISHGIIYPAVQASRVKIFVSRGTVTVNGTRAKKNLYNISIYIYIPEKSTINSAGGVAESFRRRRYTRTIAVLCIVSVCAAACLIASAAFRVSNRARLMYVVRSHGRAK